MRNFLDMLKESYDENIRIISNKKADKRTLRKFAKLTQRLRFESSEISVLKKYSYLTRITITDILLKSILVIIDSEEIKSQRYELSRKRTYIKDNEFLYLNIIYNLVTKRDEDFTSFFVRRSIFFTFYDRYL